MRKTIDVDVDRIRRLYEQNKSQEEIASLLGVSQWVISKRMSSAGIARRNRTWRLASFRRKYHQDDCALDVLTPKSAWILGWMISDGYITKNRHRFVLLVALKDRDILCKFKDFFEFDGPIVDRETTLKVTGRKYRSCYIGIHSERLIKRLMEYGIRPRKSQGEIFPHQILQASEEVKRCFIRGVFEGDGTLGHNKCNGRSQLVFQIVGARTLLKKIQRVLMGFLGLRKTSLTRYKASRNHYALRYAGNLQAKRIFDWVYADAEWFLDRKYNMYREVVK